MKISIVVPDNAPIGTVPMEMKAEGFRNPIEVVVALQVAIQSLTNKISEKSKLIVPPFRS